VTSQQHDLAAFVLQAAFDNQLVAEDAEAGVARLAALSNASASAVSWHQAIAQAIADGLIHDPVRLLPGALKCDWRLELTPAGHAALMRLRFAARADRAT